MLAESLQQQLTQVVGADHLLTDDVARSYYAQDVYTKGNPAGAVIQPASVDELSAAVKAAVAAGVSVVARGGGMSYTSGYVPQEENALLVDTSRMNRILEINSDDMYVTVESGITWNALHVALKERGLRTPFWGTLSGLYATVGGSVSQNSIFWGSGQYGISADSVLGLQVVTASGEVLTTGSASQQNAKPFLRHFGPDLTGIFTGDAGALGIKATVTLRLLPEFASKAFGSFAFESHADMLAAMTEISRQNLVMECFGFDPYLQKVRMTRESLTKDVKAFAGVLKSAGGIGKALKTGAKMALSGRGFMDDVAWSFHTMIEQHTDDAAAHCLQQVRAIVKANNGRELPDSIPKLVRANPFGPVNNMIGPGGERWVPVHALVAHSDAIAMVDAVEAVFDAHRAELDEQGVGVGYLLAAVSNNCSAIEPVFFWPDALEEIHCRSVEPTYLKNLNRYPENLDSRAVVAKVRKALVDLFSERGAVHLQVGKSYRYADALKPESLALVKAIKQALDPDNRLNPGALGL